LKVDGVSIWAGFQDQESLEGVASGRESFKAGDQLLVDLVAHQMFNDVKLKYDIKALRSLVS
jgi:hypothetical protein